MNYNEIKGPNGLSEFLLQGLSPETLYSMYKDYKKSGIDIIINPDNESSDPDFLVQEHIRTILYTAGYNLVRAAVEVAVGPLDGSVSSEGAEQVFEDIINE